MLRYWIKLFISIMLLLNTIDAKKINPDISQNDFGEITICENGILTLLSQLNDKKEDWGIVKKNSLLLLNTKERQELAYLRTSVLDYFAQLEYIKQLNKNFPDHSSREINQKEFTYYYLAFRKLMNYLS